MSGASRFEWRERDGVSWLAWEAHGVRAAFPARAGGVSAAPFDSLNLGFSVDDRREAVLENRRRLCAAVEVPLQRLVVPGQVHGTAMRWVGEAEAGRGAADSTSVVAEHDGLLSAAAGLGLVISYADCVPIVIAADGEEGPAFATVHAGWRGMIAGIGGLAAARLARGRRLLGPRWAPASVPAASSSETTCGAGSKLGSRGLPAPRTVDLWHAARLDLEQAGVPADSRRRRRPVHLVGHPLLLPPS